VLAVVVALGLAAGSAEAARDLPGFFRFGDLEAGLEVDSLDGVFTFSDFEFTVSGFDDTYLDDYLLVARESGFRLLLGFGAPFDEVSSVEMTYQVTANGPFAIAGASIPLFWILDAVGPDPLAEVAWQASNGAVLETSVMDGGFIDGVGTTFAPVPALTVSQIVTLSSGLEAIVKIENAFEPVDVVPEPGTGLLVVLALGAGIAARRSRRLS
jgi:hypothetical protein